MNTTDRWTEDEIEADIESLETLLRESDRRGDPSARCAASYLRQMLRDRRETLRLKRFQRVENLALLPAAPGMAAAS